MWIVSGPGAIVVTAPEKSSRSLPHGPVLIPVSGLRAGGHANRECAKTMGAVKRHILQRSESFSPAKGRRNFRVGRVNCVNEKIFHSMTPASEEKNSSDLGVRGTFLERLRRDPTP